MKFAENIDFTRTYGSVPEDFSRRVQETLYRAAEEERTMKRMTMRTLVIAALLVTLITAGVAATIYKTIEFFSEQYGEEATQEMFASGRIDPDSRSIDFAGLTVCLHDVIVTEENTCYIGEHDPEAEAAFVPETSKGFYAAGSIAPAAGSGDVLMVWYEYELTDPAGYALHAGGSAPKPAPDAPSYAALAQSRGLDHIRMVNCVANGVLDENGGIIPETVGYEMIPRPDGTIDFSVEIPGEMCIADRETYQLSLYIGVQDVDLNGDPIGETQRMDWVVDVTPAGPVG